MPLVIHLRRNQTAIVNGAEIENVSGRTISIAVRNVAKVLRSDDMLAPEEAVTPATRLYLALQRAYLSSAPDACHMAAIRDELRDCLAIERGTATTAADLVRAIDSGNLYAALKCAQALIRDEMALPSRREAAVRGKRLSPPLSQRAPARGERRGE